MALLDLEYLLMVRPDYENPLVARLARPQRRRRLWSVSLHNLPAAPEMSPARQERPLGPHGYAHGMRAGPGRPPLRAAIEGLGHLGLARETLSMASLFAT